MIESIKHAAIRAKNGMIFLGKCHADCFHQADNIGIKLSSKADNQGFITNIGRFVNRIEAAKIAVSAGQVGIGIEILISEDLWSPVSDGRFAYNSIKGYFKNDQ